MLTVNILILYIYFFFSSDLFYWKVFYLATSLENLENKQKKLSKKTSCARRSLLCCPWCHVRVQADEAEKPRELDNIIKTNNVTPPKIINFDIVQNIVFMIWNYWRYLHCLTKIGHVYNWFVFGRFLSYFHNLRFVHKVSHNLMEININP